MRVEFATDFAKDLRALTDAKLRSRIEVAISALERAPRLQRFPQ